MHSRSRQRGGAEWFNCQPRGTIQNTLYSGLYNGESWGGSSQVKNSCIHGHKKPVVYGSYALPYTITTEHRVVCVVVPVIFTPTIVEIWYIVCLCMIISVTKELKCIGQRVGTFQICQLSKIDDRLWRKLCLKAADCQTGLKNIEKRFTGKLQRRHKRGITRERARQEIESARSSEAMNTAGDGGWKGH